MASRFNLTLTSRRSLVDSLSRDRSSRPAHSLVEKIPLPLIQEELVVSYWRKNGNFILVNCTREACPGTV